MVTVQETANVEDIEKLQRQNNKFKKENSIQKNKIINLDKKLKDQKTKTLQLEKRSKKHLRGKGYVEKENLLLKNEIQTLTEKLEKYQEEEKTQKEKGKHVGNLQQEIEQLKQELKEQGDVYNKQIENLKTKMRKQRNNLRGEKRANRKRIDRIKKLDSNIQEANEKVNRMTERQNALHKQLNEEKKKYLDLKRKTYSKQFVGDEKLTEIKEIKEQIYDSEELGYLIVEDQTYFVPLSDKKPRKVEEGITYKSGTVCKAHFYPNNNVKIVRTYKDERDNELRRLSTRERKRVSKARKRLSENSKLGRGFFNAIHDKDILILSSKQLNRYRMLFNRYENIEVIDPYSIGISQLYTKIERADIVVVRTDGTSHAITNYVKEHKGRESVFLYNVTDMDTAYAIYNKAGESRGTTEMMNQSI